VKKVVFIAAVLATAVVGALWLRACRSERTEKLQASLPPAGVTNRGAEGVAPGGGTPPVGAARAVITDRVAGNRIAGKLPTLHHRHLRSDGTRY
jgi:hypothetical protein